jgi:hypothetical protein
MEKSSWILISNYLGVVLVSGVLDFVQLNTDFSMVKRYCSNTKVFGANSVICAEFFENRSASDFCNISFAIVMYCCLQ